MSEQAVHPKATLCESFHGVESQINLVSPGAASFSTDVASLYETPQPMLSSAAAPRGPVPTQLGGFECVNKTAYGVRKCNSTELVERAGTVCSKCVQQSNFPPSYRGAINFVENQHPISGISTLHLNLQPLHSTQALIEDGEYHENGAYKVDAELIELDHD